jgi:hypothetical protein
MKMETHEEFMADLELFHQESQAMADEWAMWREQDRAKQAERKKQRSLQPTLVDVMELLHQLMTEMSQLRNQTS